MKTRLSLVETTRPKSKAGHLRTACTGSLLPLLLLLTLPAVVQAQDYRYTTHNGMITITEYIGPGGAVVIPDTIGGLPVTSIGGYMDWGGFGGWYYFGAFYGCTSLTSVTIPYNVTSIGELAFACCTSLTSVTIPYGVTSIGAYAFDGCTSLASVTIGGGVSSIGDGAFYYCPSLKGVYFQGDAPTLGSAVFAHDDNATVYYSPWTTGWGPTFGGLPTEVLPYTYTIDSGTVTITKYIGPGGDVVIPETIEGLPVTSITAYTSETQGGWLGYPPSYFGAFYGCTSLTSVTIPDSISSLIFWWPWGSYGTFEGCSSLTGVYFKGNAPSADGNVFRGDDHATVYYLPGTTGWGSTFGDRPTALWRPQMQSTDTSFGVQTNQFGFNIAWASNMVVVVEACTDLANPIWSPLQTNTLSADCVYFSDPECTNYPARFYRLRSP